jgi:hypothetical protein
LVSGRTRAVVALGARSRKQPLGLGLHRLGRDGVVVALPELLSATTDVGFPTISGTVGHLEYWHPELALLVVGLLVWGGFHAIRVTAPELPRVPATAPAGEKVATPPATAGGLVRGARRPAQSCA